MSKALKLAIHNACIDKLAQREVELKHAISKVKESIHGESKSTAGDKYETARAMGHNELDQLSRQLNLVHLDQARLNAIEQNTSSEIEVLGKLITTDQKMIYISVALGKIEIDHQVVFIISPESPLAQQLRGVQLGNSIFVGSKEEKIMGID